MASKDWLVKSVFNRGLYNFCLSRGGVKMGILEWSDRLDIGVQDMNREHQHLLGIMNRLYDRNLAKAERAEIRGLLKELGDYTVKHFGDEEKYFDSIGFPDSQKHKLIHQDLLTKFTGHVAAFDKSGALDDSFFAFLKMWLSAHIQGVDMKYGEFSKGKK